MRFLEEGGEWILPGILNRDDFFLGEEVRRPKGSGRGFC